MAVLPVGFFMPLPLPIMIPFMMWQSAAIAAGFGTYFQFAKRRVSAMSNEEFNKSDPHELVNSMYEDIVKSIPSSFAKVDSLTPVILQSMNVMLDQAVKWLAGVISGNVFGTPNPVNEPLPIGGDITPDLDIELLNPSFEEIKLWPITKLNLIHEHQINQYTSRAQGFINSIWNKLKRDVSPVPDTIPLDTLPGKVRHFKYFPGIFSNILIDALNKAFADGNNTRGFLILGRMLDTANQNLKSRSPTTSKLGSIQKITVQQMILAANDDLKISGGLN